MNGLDIESLRVTEDEAEFCYQCGSGPTKAQLGKALWGYHDHLERWLVLPFGAGVRSAETMLALEEQLAELREALEQANIERPAADPRRA